MEKESVIASGVVVVGSVGDGSSTTAKTKSVRVVTGDLPPSPMFTFSYNGPNNFGDEFACFVQVLQTDGGVPYGFDLTVERLDAPHGWGQDLVLNWTATSWGRGTPDDAIPRTQSGWVRIGSCGRESNCRGAAVSCVLGAPVVTLMSCRHPYGDSFAFAAFPTDDGSGFQVVATRQDDEGWGLQLDAHWVVTQARLLVRPADTTGAVAVRVDTAPASHGTWQGGAGAAVSSSIVPGRLRGGAVDTAVVRLEADAVTSVVLDVSTGALRFMLMTPGRTPTVSAFSHECRKAVVTAAAAEAPIAGAGQPAPSTGSPEEATLVEMGFAPALAAVALRRSHGNLEAALELLFSGTVEAPPADAPPAPPPPRFIPNLARQQSLDVMDTWAAAGSSYLPEYQPAVDAMVVRHTIMSTSPQQAVMAALDAAMAAKPLPTSFEPTLLRCIRKAYSLSSDRTARRHYAGFPGVSEMACVFPAVSTFAAGFTWQRQYIHAVVDSLTDVEDADGLALMLALMVRGSRECSARKRHVFSTILARYTASKHASAAPGGAGSGDDPARVVHDWCVEYIDDVKTRAFNTTFIQPTLMMFRAMRDITMEGDTDVHGANTLLALLASTIGVRLSRAPFLGDEAKGYGDFLAAKLSGVEELWHPDAFGKAWESVAACRRPRVRGYGSRNTLGFVGGSAGAVANAAVDPAPSNAPARKAFAAYLNQFATYFSAEFLLPRMVTTITGDGGRMAALSAVWRALAAEEGFNPGDFSDDVRYWLWDMEALPITLNFDNARRLFARAGVAKAA